MVVTVSLGRPYARIICSIFPLCMESNALEKSTNNSVASRVFLRNLLKFDGWSKCVISWINYSENHLVFLKNFLNFRLYAVELQSIVDFGRNRSKRYTSVVLVYSEVTLLGEREDASVYYVLLIYDVAVSEQYVVEFPCFLYFWGYFIKTCNFPAFNFC